MDVSQMKEALKNMFPEVLPNVENMDKAIDDIVKAILDEASGNGAIKKARYGEQKISKSLYKKLREKTPSPEIMNMVNENIELPMDDPALPGLKIELKEGQKHALEADHIVPMKKIVCMEGFDQLSFDQQLEVLNYKKNFVGLSKTANTSKGSKSFKEWTMYVKGNIKVNPEFREKMIKKEEELEGELQELIDKMLKEGSK